MSQPAVDVQRLVKIYDGRRVVDGASFQVLSGTVTALLGPNGAGKTTTVETCEGFRRPDDGSVRVLGLDPIRDGAALRPKVGVMLQAGGLYPGARPAEVLRMFASYAAHPLDVDDLLEQLGLADASRTICRRLSGGQRQRLSLAVALVGRPELVFLDEPTAGMDPQARRATWEIIRSLRASGVTVVLTTHYIEEAEQLADAVVVIDEGKVVAAGTPAELVSAGTAAGSPSPAATLRFGAPAALDLSGLRAALPAGAAVREAEPGRYVIDGDVGGDVLGALTTWCAARRA